MKRQRIELPFPFLGLIEAESYEDQPKDTAAIAQNVRGFDPTNGQAKGSQRSGLSKYYAVQIAANEIQDVCHVSPSVEYVFITTPLDSSLGYVAGGIGAADSYLGHTSEYSTADTWTARADMPSPGRARHAAARIGTAGYSFGGSADINSDEIFSDNDEYTPDVWVAKTDVTGFPRHNATATTIGDAGYLFGGETLDSSGPTYARIADTDEYDPDTWTSKTDMPTARLQSTASTISSAAYVFGGLEFPFTLLQDTDEYVPDTWTAKTSMTSAARYLLASSTIGSAAYIYGGDDFSDVYDYTDEYAADTWTAKTDMPPPARSRLAGLTLGGSGYIFGGEDNFPSYEQSTDKYDPSTDTWASQTDMSDAIALLAAF